MTDLSEQLLDHLHRRRDAWPFLGESRLIRAVAIHPVTYYKALTQAVVNDRLQLNGFPVVLTRAVAERQLRLIPKAQVSYPGSQHGQPCPWPAFTIEKPEQGDWRHFQDGTTVDESGRLKESSSSFDHRDSYKLGKRPV